jgi:glycolate oxidase FAD binding subunit
MPGVVPVAGRASVVVTDAADSSALNRVRESIRDAIRDASAAGRPLRLCGRGAWMDAGRPAPASDLLELGGYTGIVEYVPGDLTITVRGGTTLGEIRDATAAHDQWLPLDPFGDDDGSIGATVATASSGPLATFFGTPRDLVLGLEFVSGTGAIARGGGRVVKNVAGFDLTRLMIGSWGTLGAITEATLRLYARPEADASFAIGIDGGGVERVRALMRQVPFKTYACEILNAALAARIGLPAATTALVRLGGNHEAVATQRQAFAELGTPVDVDSAIWKKLRGVEPEGASVVRLSDLPTAVAAVWAAAARVPNVLVHASPARGVVRVIGDASLDIAALRDGQCAMVAERLSAAQWQQVPGLEGALPARIKRAFDPRNVLNPGILGVEA